MIGWKNAPEKGGRLVRKKDRLYSKRKEILLLQRKGPRGKGTLMRKRLVRPRGIIFGNDTGFANLKATPQGFENVREKRSP